MTEVNVAIRGIAVGGAAVGRVVAETVEAEEKTLVGMTAFVPFAAPGETIRAQVRKRQARYLEADLIAVEEASPQRVIPPCPHFGPCGGCDLQHLEYSAQLDAKRDLVLGALRAGGLGELADTRLSPPVAGPPYGYRQRITLHVAKDGRVGYHKRRSHELLTPTVCPITLPVLEAFLAEGVDFRKIWHAGLTADLWIDAGENGVFGVLRFDEKLPKGFPVGPVVARMNERFAGGMLVAGKRTVAAFGIPVLVRRIGGQETHATPGVFSQANAVVNDALIAKVSAIATQSGAKTAYDLYAGAGNFSLPLGALGLRVFAVESDPVLVGAGQAEASRRGLSESVLFTEGDVARVLRRRHERADLVIADPPRSGLGPLVPMFDFSEHLILISCDLPGGVRDLKALVENGWQVQEIVPFDMFAQTAHIELFAYLRREKPSGATVTENE